MKFNHIDWKILAFKVGKKNIFLNGGQQFQMTLTAICGNFLHYKLWIKNILYWNFELRARGKNFKKTTWFSFIKKLLSRSRYKIEQNTKLLIALRWNWNTIIWVVRLFLQTNLTLSKRKFEKLWKLYLKWIL